MSYIPSKPLSGHVKPGAILARNKETGVIMRVRPEMLDMFPFEVIDEGGHSKSTWTSPSTLVDEPVDTKPAVIMTASGKPYKTEVSAKNAMKSKGLSDMEYIVIPDAEGFIISRV